MFVFQISTSAELVFLDSSSSMEEFNLRVFVLVTHTPIGALPLGLFVTSDETTDTLVQALELFSELLPENAFYGRGRVEGPLVIMTDNCSELRDALGNIWPNSKLLLCIFHILQQVWRWLFDSKHHIPASSRPEIMSKFKTALYQKDEQSFETSFEELLSFEAVSNHPNLVSYLTGLYEVRAEWALCFRKGLILRGNNTNNPVEAQFLVLKDSILNRTKEININGLFEKLTNDFDDHYKVKLLNVASGSFDGVYARKFKNFGKNAVGSKIFRLPSSADQVAIARQVLQLGPSIYTCPSFSDANISYTVDMDIGICNCEIGSDGSVCKHQYILWAHKLAKSESFIPFLSAEERKGYAYIAIGKSLPDSYYDGVHSLDSSDQLQPHEQTFEEQDSFTKKDQERQQYTGQSRMEIERTTAEECKVKLEKTTEYLMEKINSRKNDQAFLNGLLKFCDRVEKFPTSRLTSLFHSFGSSTSTSRNVTISSKLQKAKRGKIFVQPESVKRRKMKSGTKNAKVKGMRVKNNPFEFNIVNTKRVHKFSENVRKNEAVPKKAGRSMSSRTKHLSRSESCEPQKKRLKAE